MLDNEFGKRIIKLMEITKISNKELTEKANLSKNDVSNYRNGQIPNAMNLLKISQILGTSIEYLLTGKDESELTQEEKELLHKYRKLDETGRRYLRYAIELAKNQQDS